MSDWTQFLINYIKNSPPKTSDMIVPSHAAPHLLGQTFLELIKSPHSPLLQRGVRGDFQSVKVEMAEISHPVGTPFEQKLVRGVVAVSMATWKCPANCVEPCTCPHLHKPREWNLEELLKKWARKYDVDAFHVFPAHHFAYAVSAIPVQKIIDAWMSLKPLLKRQGTYLIGIATTSACHGIVSLMKVTVTGES